MAGPNYDAMASEETETEEEVETEAESTDPSDDDEYLMHAEEAGFSGEKAKALWRAVARCVELTGGAPLEADLLEDL